MTAAVRPPTDAERVVVLIPSYEPDEKLVRLAWTLTATWPGPVVVVDDGSGPAYRAVFDRVSALGAVVIGHETNRGKGYALKAGFAYIEANFPDHDVVCADSDGQHTPADIARVAKGLLEAGDGIVLGARAFVGDVPAKSRFGNTVTRFAYFAATRRRLQDTQTGLRAYPAARLAWLRSIEGDRFDYELNVLLEARSAEVPIIEVPIETVYLDGNASSHFDPVVDSVRVYLPLVKFGLSSLGAFLVDVALVVSLSAATHNLALAVVSARAVSASLNFATNRRLVFRAHGNRRLGDAARYVGLVLAVLAANYATMAVLTGAAGLAVLPAKLLTEGTLFTASYQAQKRLVFGRRAESTRREQVAIGR